MQIKLNWQCAMNFYLVVKSPPTPFCSREIPTQSSAHNPKPIESLRHWFNLILLRFCSILSWCILWCLQCKYMQHRSVELASIWTRLVNKSFWETLKLNTCFIPSLMRVIVAAFGYTTNTVMLWPPVSWAHFPCPEERKWDRLREKQSERPYH